MGWKITDWEHFEPPWRKDRNDPYAENIPYILLPTNSDKEGYITLTEGPNGERYLGCWVAIVQFWARQKRGRRENGCLWSGNVPATAKSIARARRLPHKYFAGAIAKLLQIGWLQEWQTDDGQLTDICQADDSQLPGGREEKLIQEKRREEKRSPPHLKKLASQTMST